MYQQIKPDRKVWKIDITTLVCKSFLQMQCSVWCEQACRIRNALWVPLLSVKNRKRNYNGSLNIWKLGKIQIWAGKYCSICVYSSFIHGCILLGVKSTIDGEIMMGCSWQTFSTLNSLLRKMLFIHPHVDPNLYGFFFHRTQRRCLAEFAKHYFWHSVQVMGTEAVCLWNRLTEIWIIISWKSHPFASHSYSNMLPQDASFL